MAIAFDWQFPYPTKRIPIFARNVVATSQPLAAQAGLRVMAAGGNAIDAAIAAAAAITLVEPCSNGLGSDCFAIIWDGQSLHGLNASGTAPAAWDLAYFQNRHSGVFPLRGWDTVTVPGCVAGWAAMHERFGRIAFEDCLAPAIELAERGFAVSPIVQEKWAASVPLLSGQPGFAEHFMPKGRAPEIGERFVLPSAAATLKRIAATRGRDFYEGETAAMLAAHSSQHGGSMTLSDLADYRPRWVQTLSKATRAYDGSTYRLHEIPPNGQGIAALMALGMLAHTPFADHAPDSTESRHLQIEAMKLAFADVYRYVADEASMRDVTPAMLLDDAYLASRAKRIDPRRAQAFDPGEMPKGGTIYMTAADDEGRMVSFIQSNYMGFGSGVVVPGTGVSLQNRGHGFSLEAGHPNVVEPGKRPFHTIIPAFLTRVEEQQGQLVERPQMSFGVMGGNMQPQGHLQTLLRMLVHRQNPQAACDAPRWKVNRGLSVDFEAMMETQVVESLKRMGHVFEPTVDSYMDFGSGQFIWRLSDDLADGYVAASDARRDGAAVGY